MYNLNRTVLWSSIDRWNYTDPDNIKPPSYTLYTGLTLGNYFLLFLSIMIAQIIAIIVIKILTVNGLQLKNWFDLVIHGVENSNIPFPWKDWDEGGGDSAAYKKRFKQVNKEMLWTMLINFFFHLMLLVPLFFTGFYHSYG